MDPRAILLAGFLLPVMSGCGGPAFVVSDPGPVRSWQAPASGVPREGPILSDGFSPEEAVAGALRRNPRLKAALSDWRAAQNLPAQVVWPAFPRGGYGAAIEPIETKSGPARGSLFVQQSIPFPGKLILRGKIAARQAEVARQDYLETLNRVIQETKTAVYELAWVYEAIRITEETRDLLARMEGVAREQYKVDKVTQQDVLKAQVELSRTRNDLLTLEDDRQSAVARLVAILDRPPGSPIGRPAPVAVRETVPSEEALYDLARENRPEIAAAGAVVRRDESLLTLRKEGYIPDFTLGFQHTAIGDGPDAYGVTFGLTLPLWIPKIRASVREGEKRVESSRARLRNAENQTFFEVKDNHARWTTSTRLVKLYRDTLIPQAEQSYRAAEAGYRAGKVDFLNYLDSQRTLLDFRLQHERAKIESLQRLAALERAVGQGL